jgi:orotidine-5'-phosphate decarboxylase
LALDVASEPQALQLVGRLSSPPGLVKVGSQLFTAAGPSIVRALVRRGERVFLDLKFHDIPHIVAEACAEAARFGVSLLTVHTSGGRQMLEAARAALEKHGGRRRPGLLGVTLLTSLNQAESRGIGFSGAVRENVMHLAELAKRCGCDGVVAAPRDVPFIRKACGRDFVIVTPGIVLPGRKKPSDQARTATAAEAVRAGADYVVVGRTILEARSPQQALDTLAASIARVLD